MTSASKTTSFQSIGILGAGAWGTALALTAVRAGRSALLWAREEEVCTAIQTSAENTPFLPGVPLPADLAVTQNASDLCACDVILSVVPAQYTADMLTKMEPDWPQNVPIVMASKGIEIASGRFMSQVMATCLPGRPHAILSGPTFAIETALNKPTAVTIAAEEKDLASDLVQSLGHDMFRPYASLDPMGAQIGGALKNVIAIACGFAAGLQFGENARAALITRGLAEMTRFALHHGAQRETMMGLSGMGDLMLTCSSTTSRNMSLGKAVGEGRTLDDILAERQSVAEGVPTAQAVAAAAAHTGVDLPICQAVHQVLTGQAALRDVMQDMLTRPFRFETD